MSGRTYGQFCGVARALDHIGDRWTLLIVRELLVEPKRYSRIRDALPGIASNLLAERLSQLVDDGLVTKDANGVYSLTRAGKDLEETVHALVRWGGRWMDRPAPEDVFRPQWLVVALRALLSPERGTGSIEISLDEGSIWIDQSGIHLHGEGNADAVVDDDPEMILAVAAGRRSPSSLKVRGSKKVAEKVLTSGCGGH